MLFLWHIYIPQNSVACASNIFTMTYAYRSLAFVSFLLFSYLFFHFTYMLTCKQNFINRILSTNSLHIVHDFSFVQNDIKRNIINDDTHKENTANRNKHYRSDKEKREKGNPQTIEHNYNLMNIRHNNNQGVNSLYSVQKKENKKFYSIKLNEKNFRWSMILSIGSKKKDLELGILTNSNITGLYCSYNYKDNDELKNFKYDITVSEDLKYIECKSTMCDNVEHSSPCLPLENYLKLINDYKIRKRSCQNKFCDYVNNMNFLNMIDKLNDRNLSICSFNTTINNEQIKGFYFKDSFFLYKKIKTSFLYFACISESDPLHFNDIFSGFIGLANYINDKEKYHNQNKNIYSTILYSFIYKSISKKNIFSLCFKQGGGFITFGGYDQNVLSKKETALSKIQLYSIDKNTNKEYIQQLNSFDVYDLLWIHYYSKNKSYYSLFLKNVIVTMDQNKVNSVINAEAIVDSYNYFLSFPADITIKLKNFVHDKCPDTDQFNDCSNLIEKGLIKLKNKNIKDFPKIELLFEEGTVIIHPEDYIIHESDGVYRVLINSSGELKLGIPFFLNKYLIFDNENERLGIGKSECALELNDNELLGVDLSSNDDPYEEKDDDSMKENFFQKYKTHIILISSGIFVSSIIGSILYFS
ncbi:aspartyl protease, putative [Plasmodium sp. gorilla clade G2]|uniref:aspartyl protease, putative n=1 Tax=Plasmodium sp. gorilla clade G2 TaxID=880535 RepID=UPI000D20CF74|nr:aspartyl protease, putative [Plasmodium sp. gorilla clade G2]SOV16990.1 aspartyl protease, putative [Plasmodium sp. gorilla clade G2]